MADSDWIDDPTNDGDWIDDAPKSGPSMAESATRGGFQGASLGFIDEVAGGLESVGQAVGLKGLGGSFSDIGLTSPNFDFQKNYSEGRDKRRALDAEARAANPGSYGAGEFGGGFATAFVPGMNVAKGASVARAGAQGAGLGGLMGAGYSEEDNLQGLAVDTGLGLVLGGAGGAAIQKATPIVGNALSAGAEKASDFLKRSGRSLYKSGLKKIDQVAERYGKEPVSDLLFERGVTGSSDDIYKSMDQIGEQLLGERNEILKQATRSGAEVDVNSAMAEAQAYVERLRKIDNPESHRVADMLQGRINEYRAAAAKAPEDVIRSLPTSEYQPEYRAIEGYRPASEELVSLPTSKYAPEYREILGYKPASDELISLPTGGKVSQGGGYAPSAQALPETGIVQNPAEVIYGREVPGQYKPGPEQSGLVQNPAEVIYGREVPAQYKPGPEVQFMDQTERVAGPTPLQTSAWKTRSANKVGDQAWQQIATSSEGQAFDKALASGLRRGTEESVGSALGAEAQATLSKKNSDLGRILTSKERALLDAEQEARRNAVSSVDGLLSGINVGALAAKKVADVSKTTKFRTVGGKALSDLGEKLKLNPKFKAIADANPAKFESFVRNLSAQIGGEDMASRAADNQQKSPDSNALIQKTQGTKYSQALQSAAQRGPQAISTTHFLLQSQDPEYRRLTLEQEEQDAP